MIRNRPTPEGRELGREVARLADLEAAKGQDGRCRSCAFRGGTVPNGCAPSLMDALKCALEGEPFYCHETKGEDRLCAGYALLRDASSGQTVEAPWDWVGGDDA